ncbi:MAG: TonB-dependent receptor plug domain-containing protein, partial [Flavisolibacter sp.]|nr:TonB-dependent receptor plug domain-containing protein [Flavisolibacter sp.]
MKQISLIMLRMCLSIFILLMTHAVYAQNRTITGRVTDPTGTGLSGVSVQVRGTRIGTTTGTDGSYQLEVPQNARFITFTSVGYGEQEVPLGSSSAINVALRPGAQSLNEVVVVGYGTRRKSDLTGAVGSVKASQLQERPAASLNEALAGRVPGVQINTNSGRPGGQTNIRIRGFSSINTSNNPLYVIDGVILPVGTQTERSNAIDFINPGDIA